MKLQNKVALVTGASQGIGRTIAVGYAREGASLIITSRSLARLELLRDEIEATGARCLPVSCDVRSEDEVQALVNVAIREFGRIDILVNNAALGMLVVREDYLLQTVRFWEVRYDAWKSIVETNLNGLFLVSKYVAKEMIQRRKGKILNLNTRRSTMSKKGFAPYGPSKAAVEAFTKIMAQELEEYGIQVNDLAPGGPTRTGMLPERIPSSLGWAPLVPEVILPAAIFLVSDESGSLSGQYILANEWNKEHNISE